MGNISSYQDLNVWKKSIALTSNVYQLCKELPGSEKFGICSQIQRSAVSIPSNIAEGHERHNLKEYIHFLGIARGSATELETQLIITSNVYHLDTAGLVDNLTEIRKMLSSLVAKLRTKT
ncbi:four helix bundle protein [Candidatus Nomurabacteria bacterium]|nr:four helix bundle protein [Candidatus Nomurabacteria bacterium]